MTKSNPKASARRLADMSESPVEFEYMPPARGDCKESGYVVPIGNSGEHRLEVRMWHLNGKMTEFAILQIVTESTIDVHVARIDCCHGSVHRHVFNRDGVDLQQRDVIARIPERNPESFIEGRVRGRLREDVDRVRGELEGVADVTTVNPDRLADARVVGQLLRSADGRALLKAAGHRHGGWVMAAHWNESLSTAIARVESAPTSPVILIAYLDTPRAVLTFEPSDNEGEHIEADVDPRSSVGLLVDAMNEAAPTPWLIRLTPFRAATVSSKELAGTG